MSAALQPHRDAVDGAVYLPASLIEASRTNPRKTFDEKKLAELAESIAWHGVLQPVLVRPRAGAKAGTPQYELVAGERRWRACQLVATEQLIPAIVREMTDFEVVELQVIENLQRDDLHPLEEAEGYQALMRKPDAAQGYDTAEDLAARIGKSRSYVFGRLKLCALTGKAREAFLSGGINASTALLIARMPPSVQLEATKKIVDGWGGEPMSYRHAREYLEREFMLKLGSAPFQITDATLHEKAGSCSECGKRTGANPDLFQDVHADVCTDSQCFAEKKELHQARLIAVAKEEGREVITGAAAKKVKPGRHDHSLKGYMAVDEVHWEINGSKPLGKLLGKDAPPIALLEDPHTRELVKVVRTEDAMKVLKDRGIVKTTRTPTTSSDQRQRDAKAKAETAWRTAVAQRAVAAVVDPKFDDADIHAWLMPEVAVSMWDRLDHETSKRASKLLGMEEKAFGARYSEGYDNKVRKHFRELTAAQLDQAFVAMAVAGQMHAGPYSDGKPTRLLEIAGKLGIDATAVRAELGAAAKAKSKPVAKKAEAKPAPAEKKPAIAGISFAGAMLRIGDQLRVKQTATGRKTAKDGRVGKVDAILQGGDKISLRWGPRAHEVGVYDNHELERVPSTADSDDAPIKLTNGTHITAAAAWPFPTGAQ